MSIPTDREPTHPGEMLLQEFLLRLGMTQRDLATAIRVPYQPSYDLGVRDCQSPVKLRLHEGDNVWCA